jgi:exonuclease III
MYQYRQLRCSVWNIHGLKDLCGTSKLESVDFRQSYIEPFDMIGLVETWTSTESAVKLPGHIHFHSTRANHRRGGILVYIKESIAAGCKQIFSKSEDVIWTRFDKSFFGLERHIYICTAYVVPENSSVYSHPKFNDTLKTVSIEIGQFSKNGDVILSGDFNAYTKEELDYIQSDDKDAFLPSDSDYFPDKMCIRRKNIDKKQPNNHGKDLLDLCIQAKLRIANGRTLGDFNGNLTSFQYNGSAVVDYVAVSEHIQDSLLLFKVHDLTSMSDHCQLSFMLKASYTANNKVNNTTSHTRSKYLWDSTAKSRFITAFASNTVQSKIGDFLSADFTDLDSDRIVDKCNDIFYSAASLSLIKKKIRKSNTRKKQWYDGECRDLKCSMSRILKRYRLFPDNRELRTKYYTLRKRYKKLCKAKLKAKKALSCQQS